MLKLFLQLIACRLTLRFYSAQSKTINSERDEIIYVPPFASYEQEISLIPLLQ